MEVARLQVIIDGSATGAVAASGQAQRSFEQTTAAAQKSERLTGKALMDRDGVTQDSAGRLRAANGQFLTEAQRVQYETSSQFGAMTRNVGLHLDGMLSKMDSSGQKMSATGGKMTRTLSVGIFALGAVTAKSFGDYEENSNVFQAVSGANAKEMEKVRETAKKLGNDLTLPGTSAADAAEAMTELAKGGLSVNQALAASKGVLQMSAAAQISNGEAAVITARALKAFNLDGKDATMVADLLAAAANNSTAEMSDLALGFQAAGSSFSTSKQPIDALAASLAIMANNGIAGSDAGTSLKTFMASLVPNSEGAAKAMEKLGFDAYDAGGKMKPLRQIIKELGVSLDGMSNKEKDYYIKKMFGSDASRAANILLKEGTAGYDKMSAAVTKGGDAARASEARNKGLNGAIDALKSTLETVAISFGEAFGPSITKHLKSVSKWVSSMGESFERMTPKQKSFVGGFVAFAAVAGPAIWVLGKLISGVATLGRTVMTVGRGIVGFGKGAVKAFRLASSGASKLVDITASMRAKTVDAIRATAAKIAELARAWARAAVEAARAAARQVAAWAAQAAAAVRSAAASVVQLGIMGAKWVWAGMQAMLGAAKMAASWVIALGPIALVIAAVAAVAYVIYRNWDTIKKWTAAAWHWVGEKIKQALGVVKFLFLNFTGVGLIIKHWDTIKRVTGVVWKWFGDRIKQAIDLVKRIFLNFTPAGLLIKHWDKVKAGVQAVASFIGDKFKSIVGAITGMGGKISRAARGMFDGVKNAFKAAINWLIKKWNGLKLSIPKVDTHIPGVGKVGGFSLKTPNIPLLEKGGTTRGPFIAGEKGKPELVNLHGNGSATVTPLGPAQRAAGARSAPSVVIEKGAVVIDARGADAAAADRMQRMVDDAFAELLTAIHAGTGALA